MEPLYGYGQIIMNSLILSFVAPIVTSLVLAMALLKPGTSFARRFLFHSVTIPILFGIIVLWFRLAHNALNALFFFTVFITAMYLYLQVSRLIRRLRSRRQNQGNPNP